MFQVKPTQNQIEGIRRERIKQRLLNLFRPLSK